MAVASSTAALIGAAVAAGSGIAANVAQNKARGQARYQMEMQRKQHEQALINQRKMHEDSIAESARIHGENMAHLNRSFAADQERYSAQLAQAERGLRLQSQAMAQAQADAQRSLNNQQAMLERSINVDNANQVQHHRKDQGVAGTLLTGPGGVDKDELKKGKHLLLGGR